MNLVIKIGTSTLTRPTTGDLHISAIAHLVEVIVELRRQGHSVVLVSSGAVGVGCTRLGITDRPKKLSTRQAVAAVGQSRLMGIYDDFLDSFSNLWRRCSSPVPTSWKDSTTSMLVIPSKSFWRWVFYRS